MRARLAALGGTGVSATFVLALLVLGCVFVAMAGPRASQSIRTQALRRTIDGVAAAGTAVAATTDSNAFIYSPQSSGEPVLPGVTTADLAAVKQQLDLDLLTDHLPLAPLGAAWASLTTPLADANGAGPRAQAGVGPKMEVLYRDTLASQSRLVTGSYPGNKRLRGHQIAVVVTEQTAARFGVHPGSRLALTTPTSGGLTLVVSGIVQPRGPAAAFWTEDSIAAAPAYIVPFKAPSYWAGSVFVGAAGLATLEHAFNPTAMPMQWEFPLQLGDLSASAAPQLVTQLSSLPTLAPQLTGSLRSAGQIINFAPPGVTQQLQNFLTAQGAVDSVLSLVFVGLAVIGAVVLLLAAQMATGRRTVEYTVLRARGASLRQLALRTLRDIGVGVVPAAAVGIAAAVALTPGSSVALAVWLTAFTVLVALAGPPVAAVIQQHPVRPGSRAAASRRTGTLQPPGTAHAPRRPTARRIVAETTLVAAAVGGLVLLRFQGLSQTGGTNLFTSAAPVLVAIPAALFVLRLYPLAVRGVLRLSSRRAGVTGFIATAWAGRAATASILPAFALVLALTLAAFAGMVRDAVSTGEVAASWRSAGADAAIMAQGPGALTPATVAALSRVPGAQHVAGVSVQLWTTAAGRTVTVVAVDPARYATLVASTPWPPVPAADLAEPASGRGAGPVPVLASASAAALLGRTSLLESGQANTEVRVAGLLSSTPALPDGGVFVVMPAWGLAAAARAQPPNLLLLTGPGLDGTALTSAVHRLVPGATVSLRAADLAALANSPLPRGAYLGFAAGLGAAAGFSVVILLLELALGAEERRLTLARLATMGLGTGQTRRLTLMETLPAVLAAALAGVACALVLVPLTGPVLNLSVFTGSAVPVPIRPGWAALGVPIAGLVGLAVATLLLQIQVERRRGVTAAMRVGQ